MPDNTSTGGGAGGASTPRIHPLPVFCFKVTIKVGNLKNGSAMFKSVGGLKYETEVVDVKVGGRNNTTIKLPGATKWSNLVFKRGFTADVDLIAWREMWLKGPKRPRAGGTIVQLDNALKPVCSWKFEGGWPCKWEVSEYDASKNELAIETLEIAHEGLVFDPTPPPPTVEK
jgi:phage tail-like protein